MVVQNASNNNSGTLSSPGPSSTLQTEAGFTYFEHNPAVLFGGNNDLNFTVNWTSPASGSGAITMYAAANLANNNGNSSGDNIVLTQATGMMMGGGVISVTVTSNNVSCFGGSNGSATANPSGGGGGPYSYNWSNGATTQTASNLSAGTYTVTVTNGSGGNGTASVTITQPTQLNASIINQVNINCLIPSGSATAMGSGGTGGYSYAWSSGATGATASNLSAGTHTVTVTDANFCTKTATVNITADIMPPTAEAGPVAQINCGNPTTTLNGTGSSTGGNFTYLWTTTNGQIISGANTLSPQVGASGTYTLTVTNTSNGCTSSDVTSVTSNFIAPTSNAGANMVITCATPQVMLNGAGSSSGANFTYLWTTSNGNIVSGANTLTPTVNAAGTYCLLVTNTANGCTATDCTSVSQNTTAPVANAGSASPLTCTTSSVTLNGSASSSGANFTYLWTTSNGSIVSGATTTMPVVNAAGIYTLTVTNSVNGCTATSSVTVVSNTTPPTADAGPGMALNCNNTVVVLNGSGSSQGANFTYAWSGPGIQSGGNTANPTVNMAGNYSITVTNTANGCTATDATTVTQSPAPTASISAQTNVNCNGANTGSATVQGSNGTGTFTYAWSNGGNTAQISNLPAGIYTATVSDSDGCTATASATITQPPALAANATATGESSVGANDGSATAAPTGGVPAYAYAWSNGETTATISGLEPGNYTVTVTDDNGCTSAQTVTVSSFSCAGFGLNFTSANPSCHGGTNGSATANPTGGTSPFTFLWSNGETTATISSLGAGNFTVTITDENGCEATGNVTMTAPPALNLSIAQQTNVNCNGAATGAATASASGGSPGYDFSWSNGASGASQTGLAAGTYTVTVTDANDCTASIQVNISQPPALAGTVTATGETAVGANNGTASTSMSGGVAPYDFEWNNSATTSMISNLPPGQYCVTVTDANGCTFSGCATVTQFGCTGTSSAVSGENVTCFGGDDGSATVTASGFEAPLTFAWSNGGSGATIGNLTAGTYTVTITDANGCTGDESIEINEPTALSVDLLSQTNLECPGQMTGSISVNGAGGTPGYDFSWSNGSANPTIQNLAAGSYEVTVSDAFDCIATLQVEIEVEPDTEAPLALAAGLTVSLDASGKGSITAAMVDGGSSDNCGIDTTFLDVYDFDCENLGENIVTLTVIDAAGNLATDATSVFVVDEIAPVILCPPMVSVTTSGCEAAVDYPEPTATDNCSNVTVFILSGPPSGSVFPAGITEVTWGADDNNGNTVFCSFNVVVLTDFSSNVSFTEPGCNGEATGSATATTLGGTPPFSYEWDDPANQLTQTATGLTAGTYTVFITDSNGCVSSTTVEITEPDPISITLVEITNETGTSMDGSIFVSMSGGAVGTYTYEWFFNGAFFSNEEDLTGLAAGEYMLVATDQNNCTVSETFIVEQLTSTSEPAMEGRISLQPNPVSNRLFVKFELTQAADAHVQIFDLTGRPVQPEQRSLVLSETLSFDLSQAAPGIYLVRLVIDENVMVRRIVVGR